MSISVTVLVDDQVERGDGLLAEHGFSLLVEASDRKVLFDTGQSDVFLGNARRLGVDLDSLDAVVLSHGHYDHGGGLTRLLRSLGRLEVIAHPDAFIPRWHRRPGQQDRYIGLGFDARRLRGDGTALHLEAQAREIGPHLLTTGAIARTTDFECANPDFWVEANGQWRPDPLDDDQALIARTREGLVVLLGCAHAGVTNTLHHAIRLTGDSRIRAVVGGLHLKDASPEVVDKTVAALREMDVARIVACHCTGFAARVTLYAAFGDGFVNGTVGLGLSF